MATESAPALLGQTVVVIGGSAGIGLETARRAREEGAQAILTARDPDRLQRAGRERRVRGGPMPMCWRAPARAPRARRAAMPPRRGGAASVDIAPSARGELDSHPSCWTVSPEA